MQINFACQAFAGPNLHPLVGYNSNHAHKQHMLHVGTFTLLKILNSYFLELQLKLMKVVTGHTLNLDVASKQPFRFTQEPMKKSKMKLPRIKAMMETATSQLPRVGC